MNLYTAFIFQKAQKWKVGAMHKFRCCHIVLRDKLQILNSRLSNSTVTYIVNRNKSKNNVKCIKNTKRRYSSALRYPQFQNHGPWLLVKVSSGS